MAGWTVTVGLPVTITMDEDGDSVRVSVDAGDVAHLVGRADEYGATVRVGGVEVSGGVVLDRIARMLEEIQREGLLSIWSDVDVPAPTAPVSCCTACDRELPVGVVRLCEWCGATDLPVPCPDCGALPGAAHSFNCQTNWADA